MNLTILAVLLIPTSTVGVVVAADASHCADPGCAAPDSPVGNDQVSAELVIAGLREFYRKTARADGSFQPGVDAQYRGMSDSVYSDLAAVTYAVTIHKTFGWKLPDEVKTAQFLQSRQRPSGEFFNLAGTVEPDSAEGRTYNTTQGLVSLRALGLKPRFDALLVFDAVLQADYKTLPPYMTSFFPLAYLAAGKSIPAELDHRVRATMTQADDGYLHDHVAATFHAVHYHRLIGVRTPKAGRILARTLRDQKPDGSWMLNMPSRDRHATFDAVFALRQLGRGRPDCDAAIQRAARWALSCRNADGGFGHFPGSPSDADAVYFHVGTLVMAGLLEPAEPLPADARLLSWGHLMPPPKASPDDRASDPVPKLEQAQNVRPRWVGGVALSANGALQAAAVDDSVRLYKAGSMQEIARLDGHRDLVVAVAVAPDGRTVASGSFDCDARLWDAKSKRAGHTLSGHRGAVVSVAFSSNGQTLATGSIDGAVKLWNVAIGKLHSTLAGHRSWVNAVAFSPAAATLASASSDGTIRLWRLPSGETQGVLQATKSEVRSIAFSPNGKTLAAGLRYGVVQFWDVATGERRFQTTGHKSDVWCVAFTPNGQRVVTGDGDWNEPGEVKFWDAASGQLLQRLATSGEVLSLACTPDGRQLVVGGGDKTIAVHAIPPAEPPGK